MEEFDSKKFNTVTEAEYVRVKMPLIEGWSKWGWLDEAHGAPPLPGHTPAERDYWRAVMAQVLQNTAMECLNTRPGDPRFSPDVHGDECVDKVWENVKQRQRQILGEDLIETTTPTKTTAWSGATNLPIVLGYVRKILPKMFALQLYQVQPLDKPTGRVFYVERKRHDDGTTDGGIAARAGWSYRSWIDDPGEATTIAKSITFTMTSADVSVTSHKIKVETSIEVEQDLRAYHGMDAVALISDGATEEMAMELDEILLHNIYRQVTVNGAGKFQLGTKPTGYTWEEWDRRILELLQRASDHVETYKRVIPNNLVFGTEWSAYLGRLAGWVPTDQVVGPNAIVRPIGTLAGTWNCFKAVFPWPVAEATMVYKGTTWTDASFFYLPYVPVMLTGTQFDPDNQMRTLSWLSRYGIHNADAAQNAWLTIAPTTITGLSYPAITEYTG